MSCHVTDDYLNLLRNILINTIYQDASIDPWSEANYDKTRREGGRDWPSKAMTMIGGKRLDNLRYAIENILKDNVEGDLIETGVWRGGACIFMRGVLQAYGVTDRRVFVADSFQGLPKPSPDFHQDNGDQHHTFSELSITSDEVKENFSKLDLLDDQVIFLEGWFKDTLNDPRIEKLAVLRLDGDMYESTINALESLYRKVEYGGFVIVDDYNSVPACRQAVEDYRSQHGICDDIINIDGLAVYWRKSNRFNI